MMNELNAHDLRFTLVELEGETCLFTEERVSLSSIPLPLLKYEVCYDNGYKGS